MNYHNITHDDMNNGDGLRVVLWVAGCNHHCKDCQNPVTWNPADGIPFGLQDKEELYRELKKDYIAGITFSGGDPLHPSNRSAVDDLMQAGREGRLEEVYGTGTAAVISPVGALVYKGEEITINNFQIGDLTQKLYDYLTGIQWGKEEDKYGWTRIVK